MTYTSSFIVIFLFLLSSVLVAQTDYSSLITEDKLSVSIVSSGHDSRPFSLDVNYFLNEYVALVGGVKLGLPAPRLGIELRAGEIFGIPRLIPYVNAQYGINRYEAMSHCAGDTAFCAGSEITATDRKVFLGSSVELGTKFKLFKRLRGYGSIGLSYLQVKTEAVNEFVSEFNTLNAADEELYDDLSNLSFSLGYTFVINSSNPDYKR